jgi:Zn-dependent membrane protease YugP
MYWIGYGWWLVIPGIILAVWAQHRVTSVYRQFLKVPGRLSGASAARRILDASGLQDVRIEMIGGQLTDHYDPRDRVLRLSEENYRGSSLSAIGVAAHEAGHALQHQAKYAPLHIRMAIVPITMFGSQVLMPAAFLGILFGNRMFIDLAILGYAILLVFQVITLPVEFNATSRAKARLFELGLVTPQEQRGVSKVLGAAALTYVAAMVVALLNLVRLVLLRGRE